MKNLFSRLGSTPATKKQGTSDADVQKLLSQAQTCLAKLRGAKEEDFPLLNESTRLGGAREQFSSEDMPFFTGFRMLVPQA